MRHFAFLPTHLDSSQPLLARRLESLGFRVSFIMHNTYDAQRLRRLGFPAEQILDTTLRREHRYTEEEIEARLGRLEDGRPPFINDIIAMDRRLRYKPDAFARRYLAHIEKVLTQFLLAQRIELISNGRDTALHLATHKICRRLGVSSVVATVIRIPETRFGFCEGYKDDKFIELGQPGPEHVEEAARLVAEFRREKPIQPFSVFERRKSRFLRRIHRDAFYWATQAWRALYDPGNDVGRYSPWRLLKMGVARRFNAAYIALRPPFEPVGKRPYIIYGYQMQPESSIDVLASHVSNQPNLISVIAKSTPSTHDFYVKPHREDIGGLSRRELVALRSIPGVRLTSPYLESHDLINGAALVLTCTGTMALEAALFGVPSVVFADEFFRQLPTVHYCPALSDLPELIPRLLREPRQDRTREAEALLAALLASTFEGRVSTYLGPFTDRESSAYVEAYRTVYDHLRSPAAGRAEASVAAGDRGVRDPERPQALMRS